MMELYLSSDGKHTVHVSAEDVDEMVKLLPQAKMIYEAVVRAYGSKARIEGKSHTAAPDGRKAPLCPVHKTPMAYREGKFGAFWSCPTRTSDGGWCSCTYDATEHLTAGKAAQ